MIVQRVVVPLVTTYVLFIVMAVATLRRPAAEPAGRSTPADRGIAVRSLVTTVVGGYLFFVLVVLVFHVWIAGQRGALRSAAAGGAFLAFGVALPVFLFSLWWPSRR